jgi:hypothetical protein
MLKLFCLIVSTGFESRDFCDLRPAAMNSASAASVSSGFGQLIIVADFIQRFLEMGAIRNALRVSLQIR